MSVGFVLVCAGLSRVRKVTKGLTAICERGVGVYAGRISTSIGVNCEAGHINRDMGWPRTGETSCYLAVKTLPRNVNALPVALSQTWSRDRGYHYPAH